MQCRNRWGRVRAPESRFERLTNESPRLCPEIVTEIEGRIAQIVGPIPSSSIRSYLRLNTPDVFVREERGVYCLRTLNNPIKLHKGFKVVSHLFNNGKIHFFRGSYSCTRRLF